MFLKTDQAPPGDERATKWGKNKTPKLRGSSGVSELKIAF
jgi:hypothetical protein